MTIAASKNLTAQSTSTTGTGTLTLGAAISGYQALGAADDGKRFDVRIKNGTAWEVARDCLYTHSGTTLTRGTFEESSTGSALSLSGTSDVYVVGMTAERFQQVVNKGIVVVTGDGSTTQSVTGTVLTKVGTVLATESLDENGWWNHTDKKFQPTRAGKFRLSFCMTFTAADFTLGTIYKNGSEHRRLQQISASCYTASGSCIVEANGSTDYFEVWVYRGVNSTIEAAAAMTWFNAEWISP